MIADSRTVELQDLKRIMSLGSFYTISTGYKKSSSTGNYTQEYKLSIIPSDFSSRQKILEKALQQTKNVSPPSSLSLPPPFLSLIPCHPSSSEHSLRDEPETNSRILCQSTTYQNSKKPSHPSSP